MNLHNYLRVFKGDEKISWIFIHYSGCCPLILVMNGGPLYYFNEDSYSDNTYWEEAAVC